jgi:hypothetical protein
MEEKYFDLVIIIVKPENLILPIEKKVVKEYDF